jgi:rhodanese-related sulfurtransferase
MTIQSLEPHDVARLLSEHSIVLIDVREPAEYAVERIPGALLFPFSTFDPLALPNFGDRKAVFHCASGVRSAKAVAQCQDAGVAVDTHLRGGIQAWKAANLPTLG